MSRRETLELLEALEQAAEIDCAEILRRHCPNNLLERKGFDRPISSDRRTRAEERGQERYEDACREAGTVVFFVGPTRFCVNYLPRSLRAVRKNLEKLKAGYFNAKTDA